MNLRFKLSLAVVVVVLLYSSQSEALATDQDEAVQSYRVHLEETASCPLQPTMEVGMCVNPETTGDRTSEWMERDSMPEGTVCLIDPGSGDVSEARCEEGIWIPAVSHGTSVDRPREKRFFWFIFAVVAVVAWVIGCIFTCSNGNRANGPPPNNSPSITCPYVNSKFTSKKGEVTHVVSWAPATATDKEDGTIGVVQTEGGSPGTNFGMGIHTITYMAKDSGGKTAHCSFTFEVKVPTCSETYTYLMHGSATCKRPDGSRNYIHGSECSYTCDKGFELVGEKQVECRTDEMWSAQKPACIAISCGPPGSVEHGRLVCRNGHTYNFTCYVECEEGYEVQKNDFITCQASKSWTSPGKCEDKTPPDLQCGDDINVFAGPKLSPVEVQWPPHAAKDNSGLYVKIRSDRVSGSLFEVGQTKVTVIATDMADNEAKCSFMVIVNVKRCPNLYTPENGYITCSHGNAYGSVCTVTCYQAYQLEGNEDTSTCQADQTWSKEVPKCVPRSCEAPPPIPHGHYECNSGYLYQDSCSLVCDPGYNTVPPLTITCNVDINWTSSGPCSDTQAPAFPDGCSPDMDVTAASLGEPTYVVYPLPNVTDNSGETPTVKGSPVSGTAFSLGATTVTITAFDSQGNNDSCQFVTNVRNISCSRPNLDRTGKDLIAYSCPNRYVFGATCELTCKDGNPITGATSIKCEKEDNSDELDWTWPGNVKPFCDPQVCPKLTPPINGALSCDKFGSSAEVCLLMCHENFMYPSSAPDQYVCLQRTGTWSPNDFVPGCTARRRPGTALIKPSFYYFATECSSNNTEIKGKFLQAIAASTFKSVCTNNMTCTVDSVEVTCGPVSNRKKRGTILGHGMDMRERRAADSVEYKITAIIVMRPIVDLATPADTLRFISNTVASINEHLIEESNTRLFDIPEIGTFDGFYEVQAEYECDPGTKFVSRTMSCAGCGEGHMYDNSTKSCIPCPRGSYQNQELSFSCTPCPTGMTTINEKSTSVDQCLNWCPLGESSESGIQPCDPCAKGSYQSKLGGTSCRPCPFGMSTLSLGASSVEECLFYNVRLSESRQGPIIERFDSTTGTFTILTWVHSVSSLPTMTLTFALYKTSVQTKETHITLDPLLLSIRLGEAVDTRTIRKWYHVAIVYKSGTATLYVNGLSVNTIDDLQMMDFSKKFTFTGSQELSSLVVSGTQMTSSALTELEVQEFARSCSKRVDMNILGAMKVDEMLVTPSTCDDTDDCAEDPCGQHGTCLDGTGQFTCLCEDPWSGDRCENVPDFCAGHDCSNGGSCISQPEHKNYSCTCEVGYKGVLCDQRIVNGGWGSWSNFSGCSVTCGRGHRSRVRECNNPWPDPEGEGCQGSAEEYETCEAGPCPVDCVWDQWSEWMCGSTCGHSTGSRTRTKKQEAAYGGQECVGIYLNRKNCDLPECPVDGKYGEWSDWSQCSKSCGGGVSLRFRTCTGPAPANGGAACDTSKGTESKACNVNICPVCKTPELRSGQKTWNCTTNKDTNMQICQVVCLPGLTFAGEENSFECGPLSNYTWSHQTRDNPIGLLPACSEQKIPAAVTPQVVYTYNNIDCNKGTIVTDLKTAVSNQVEQVVCTDSSKCQYNITHSSSCGSKKRSLGTVTLTLTVSDPSYNNEEPQYFSTLSENEAEAEQQKLYDFDTLIATIMNKSQSIFTVDINGVTYVGQVDSSQAIVYCHKGSGFYGGLCMDCPAGSYSYGNGSCVLCEHGSYQNQVGMSSCIPCPDGTSTAGKGSYLASHCEEDPPTFEDIYPSYIPPGPYTNDDDSNESSENDHDGREETGKHRSDDGLHDSAIAGIVIAAAAVAVAVGSFIVLFIKYKVAGPVRQVAPKNFLNLREYSSLGLKS